MWYLVNIEVLSKDQLLDTGSVLGQTLESVKAGKNLDPRSKLGMVLKVASLP